MRFTLLVALVVGCTPPRSERIEIRTGHETAAVVVPRAIERIEIDLAVRARGSQVVVTEGMGLSLLATVRSPKIKGAGLHATDVQWRGDRIYASYNLGGDAYGGAIQIIDATNRERPRVIAEAVYPRTDISRLMVSGDAVLAAAADLDEGATFERFRLRGDELELLGWEALGSYAATHVSVDDYRAYVAYGDTAGGVAVIDLSGEQPVAIGELDSFDARWVGEVDDTDALVIAGSPGRIERHRDVATPGAGEVVVAEVAGASVGAPTSGHIRGDLLMFAADESGLLIYDVRDLSPIGRLPTSGTANGIAVAADGRLAFLANGEEGLVVADLLDPAAPERLARLDVPGDGGSANAIAVAGAYIALADGRGGVKIVRYDRVPSAPKADCDGDGEPDSVDPDDDDDGALDGDDTATCDPDRVCDDGQIHLRAGWVGDVFNLPCDHPDLEAPDTGIVNGTLPSDHDWFTDRYYSFTLTRARILIGGGKDDFPIDEGLCGDPDYYAVHWRTTAVAPADGSYRLKLASHDDGWLFIDGELILDLGGAHGHEQRFAEVALSQGSHRIDIYYAQRHRGRRGLEFAEVGSSSRRLDIGQHLCLDSEGDEDGDGIANGLDVAPLSRP